MYMATSGFWASYHAALPPEPPPRSFVRATLKSSHAAPCAPPSSSYPDPLRLTAVASAALFLGGVTLSLATRPCSAAVPLVPVQVQQLRSSQDELVDEKLDGAAPNFEDKKLAEAFDAWKSKTFALTVPLRVVALRGSVPPSWVKEFAQSQGKRVKFQLNLSGSLNGIFSDLLKSLSDGKIQAKSVGAADMVSVGDSWLNYAIQKDMIQPMDGAEDQDWFKGLSSRWKVYLRRNGEGDIDPDGKIWAAPYRWGCTVIAYKKSKFQQHGLAPIEDWKDLWRPELAGKISMVDSPREVIGAVLKHMGASYNTNAIDLQVDGGKTAVLQNLESLTNQVRLFDSANYLKAFGVGDVWVTVGWSSDVISVAKRMSNVAVVVPKSGASLWADLWAIPAASRLQTNRIGGRVRGPSPLIHQWVEFCLQAARAVPFKQEVIPGSSPFALENALLEVPKDLPSLRGKPKLDSNLVAGVPPPEILARCEFLEPLSDSSVAEYNWLISSVKKSESDLLGKVHRGFLSLIQRFWPKVNAKSG